MRAVPEVMSWWSPAGWTRQAPPEPFVKASVADLPSVWEEEGYSRVLMMDDDESWLNYSLWRNKDGHLHIQVWTGETCVEEFFVRGPDVAAFCVEKLPSMLNGAAALSGIERDRRLLKTLIAFVRFGHGEDTIDDMGHNDRDDIILERRTARAAQNRTKP